jgi:hypothetical protein
VCEAELPTQQARRTGDDEGRELRATGRSLSGHGWRDLDVNYSRDYFEKTWGNLKTKNDVAGSEYSPIIGLGNIILDSLLSSQLLKRNCTVKA